MLATKTKLKLDMPEDIGNFAAALGISVTRLAMACDEYMTTVQTWRKNNDVKIKRWGAFRDKARALAESKGFELE